MMRSVNAPQHLVQSVIVIGRPLGACSFDNDLVVLLVSDPQAVKSLSALVVPVGSLEDPEAHQGLAHYLEHMCLMGSKKYPQADSLR